MTKIKLYLTQMWNIIRNQLWVQYACIEWVLPFELISITFGIASWVFFTKMFNGTIQYIQQYGCNPISYIILGMAFIGFLSYASTGIYGALMGLYSGTYWSGGYRLSLMEYLRLAKIPPALYVAANYVLTYFRQFLMCLGYLIVGFLIFGLKFNQNSNYFGAFVALVLGIVACLGIGMISASTIWLLGAWHGVEPINWTLGLFASIVSGVYFPPDVLPSWLKMISYYFPHTYAMEAAKLALLAGYDNNQLVPYFLRLIVFSTILILMGIYLIKLSSKREQEKGSLM